MATWWTGTADGDWNSMGVVSSGEYGTPEGLIFSFPVTVSGGKWKIVEGLSIDAFSQECINKTLKELLDEQSGVAHLL